MCRVADPVGSGDFAPDPDPKHLVEFLKALKKARELRLAPSHHAIVRELDSEKMYETEYNSNMWTQQGGIIAFFKNWDGDG